MYNNNEDHQVNFLNIDQATDLVDRIEVRAKNFNHSMTTNEKESMAQLLSNIGVNTSDLIDVSNLADNYAINAEIISPDEASSYSDTNYKEDSLFQWEETDGTHYCLSW